MAPCTSSALWRASPSAAASWAASGTTCGAASLRRLHGRRSLLPCWLRWPACLSTARRSRTRALFSLNATFVRAHRPATERLMATAKRCTYRGAKGTLKQMI